MGWRDRAIRFHTQAAHPGLPPDHRHAHDFLVLIYVEEGDGSFAVGAGRPLRAGEVHAVPPGQVIGVAAVSELARCRAWSVAFTPEAVPPWPRSPRWPGRTIRCSPCSRPGRGMLWSPSQTGRAGRAGSQNWPRSSPTRAVSRLARPSPRYSPGCWSRPRGWRPRAPSAPDPLVERVFDEIEATFREPVSAADVARALGYTPGHLTTLVRRRTTRPLLEWITERRMIEVRRMLRETDLPLGVVASQTGLRDVTYLVRRFRDRYGITPERWRRSQRAGQ